MRPLIRHNYRDYRHVGRCVDVMERALRASASEGGFAKTPVRYAKRAAFGTQDKLDRTPTSRLALANFPAARPGAVQDLNLSTF
jgi:hypothetical protein